MAAALIVMLGAFVWPAHAQRFASVNLCADQLLLALAPPDSIVTLGPFARDPGMSFMAQRAHAHESIRGTAEELTRLKPDLILIGAFDNRYTRALLERHGARFHELGVWSDLPSVWAGVRDFAKAIGRPGGGEALVTDIERSLQRLETLRPRFAHGPSFVVLHRRGYVAARGVTEEVLEAAGLRNLSRKLDGSGFVRLENIITLRPDFLMLADARPEPTDQGQALLRHPALEHLYPPSRRIVAPDRLTMCPGPATPALIDWLGRQLHAAAGHS